MNKENMTDEEIVDLIVMNESFHQKLMRLFKAIADPVKLQITKKMAEKTAKSKKMELYLSELVREMKTTDRKILVRLLHMDKSSADPERDEALFISHWETRETRTKPRVRVKIYEPLKDMEHIIGLLYFHEKENKHNEKVKVP